MESAAVSTLAAFGAGICWIIVLIKLFRTQGVLRGILGIFCVFYSFIWGWANAGRLNLRILMLIWTILWAVAVITSRR